MNIRIGTNHFISFQAACDYYASYGDTRADVERKLRDGEIHIGQPRLKPDEHLITVDHDWRYAIVLEEGNNSK